MSIINQTLKELDKRQQTNKQSHGALPAYSAPARRWPLRIATLIAAILFGALLVVVLQRGLLSRTAVAEPDLTIERVPVIHTDIASSAPQADVADEDVEVVATEPVPQVLVPATRVVTRAEQPQDSSQQRQRSEEIQPTSSTGEMHVERVERDAPELAQHKLEQARERLEQGQGRRAEQLLHEALVLQPAMTEARQQLAAYYYGRGFNSQAIRLLQEGLAITPGDSRLVLLKARIYESSGRPDEALQSLRGLDLSLPEDADLLVLRAALATEHADFELAAESYQALVKWRPSHGSWWLGLALAYDELSEPAPALAAYERALREAGLDEQSQQFIRQRIGALH